VKIVIRDFIMPASKVERNIPFIKKWIKVLRSDTYMQGQRQLIKESFADPDMHDFCCLGVACNILPKKLKAYWDENNAICVPSANGKKVLKDGGILPKPIRDFIGLTPDEQSRLITYNDTLGYTFHTIADKLEYAIKNSKKLPAK
jgi:hypothetical protein